MNDRFPIALREQAKACEALGSPFMKVLLELLAERLRPDTPLTKRLFNWPGDAGPAADSVPLRLAGALHALRMLERCGLQDAYPPNDLDVELLWGAVSWAFDKEAAFISTFIDSPPQTNEIRRSAGLIATGHWLTHRFKLPIALREIGASAGLNMMWDQFALSINDQVYGPPDSPVVLTPTWTGPLPPHAKDISIISRQGVDLSPVDLHSPIDRLRLKSYIWPDQPDRLEKTDAAIALFDAKVVAADAVDWLNNLDLTPNALTLIYSTIAWQYLPKSAQTRGESHIQTLGSAATQTSPVAWLQIEHNGTDAASITLRLWPRDLKINLGRMDFHGRWVNWSPPI